MYPGQDVIVNPGSAGYGVLLYPGGKYGRVVHPLLQPGEPFPGTAEKPIHLHMPRRHIARRVTPKAPPQAVAAGAPSAPPAVATAAPPSSSGMLSSDSASGFSGFDTIAPAQPAKRAAAVAPKPVVPHPAAPLVAKAAPPKPAPVPAALKPVPTKPAAAVASRAAPIPFSLTPEPGESVTPTARIASAEPPPRPASPATAGLVRQSQILFGPGVADPVPESIDAIKGLASPLNSALAGGASRVQVVAYGGPRGDKSSDARRLSLRRALIIRQLLIDGGVPSDRIDVRAMGGATDNDPTDRVDVFTKS